MNLLHFFICLFLGHCLYILGHFLYRTCRNFEYYKKYRIELMENRADELIAEGKEDLIETDSKYNEYKNMKWWDI